MINTFPKLKLFTEAFGLSQSDAELFAEKYGHLVKAFDSFLTEDQRLGRPCGLIIAVSAFGEILKAVRQSFPLIYKTFEHVMKEQL